MVNTWRALFVLVATSFVASCARFDQSCGGRLAARILDDPATTQCGGMSSDPTAAQTVARVGCITAAVRSRSQFTAYAGRGDAAFIMGTTVEDQYLLYASGQTTAVGPCVRLAIYAGGVNALSFACVTADALPGHFGDRVPFPTTDRDRYDPSAWSVGGSPESVSGGQVFPWPIFDFPELLTASADFCRYSTTAGELHDATPSH